jgi:hypothetical protein
MLALGCCTVYLLNFYFQVKSNPEEVQEQVRQLLDLLPFRSHWEPVEQLIRLGGITLLLQIIAFAYEWNYAGRSVSFLLYPCMLLFM